jgi:5-methyltetrahydrofolate--homocysteine methyltransferase
VNTLDEIKTKVIDINVQAVLELTKKALDEGFSAGDILNQALIPAMDVVGDEYERGERFLPEMLLSADVMKEAMEILRPLLVQDGVKIQGRVVMGTVEGDLHDIGLNIVSMILEGTGFEVNNLGVDVNVGKFIEAVEKHDANLLGLSALLTTTMLKMKEVIKALDNSKMRDKVKVMIGGAPVTKDYADEIGADGYAPDAFSAVALAKRLLVESDLTPDNINKS